MVATTSSDSGDLLVIVLDLNAVAWSDLALVTEQTASDVIQKALETVLVFANAHLAIRHENALAVYAAVAASSHLLFTTVDSLDTAAAPISADASTYQKFRVANEAVLEGARQAMQIQDDDATRPVGMVGALAKALCHINRISKDQKKDPLRPRILILSVSPDSAGQYIPVMNCIFAAQKASVPIDVCRIARKDAVFWQQAAHLTAGNYFRLDDASKLLQALMMTFLPGREARKRLNLPRQEQVDLRAACFCHRNIIDVGYVCSVCLSIFCTPVPICSTCKTRFPLSTLRRLRPSAPAQPKKASAPRPMSAGVPPRQQVTDGAQGA